MKLLIDMNLSPRWTAFFAASHIEAIHWSIIGKADAPDIEIMEYAKTNDYAVFTNITDILKNPVSKSHHPTGDCPAKTNFDGGVFSQKKKKSSRHFHRFI